MNITPCRINEVVYQQDGQNPLFYATADLPVLNYNIPRVPIYSSGVFYYPLETDNALFVDDGTGRFGCIIGYTTPIASGSIMSDMVAGEMGIYNRGNFKYSLKAKLESILSTFINSEDVKINTTLPITENLITCIKDMMAEEIAYQTYNNQQITILKDNITKLNTLISKLETATANFDAHTHISNVPTQPSSTPSNHMDMTSTQLTTLEDYTVTDNFTRDKNIVDNTPTQLQICPDGKVIV